MPSSISKPLRSVAWGSPDSLNDLDLGVSCHSFGEGVTLNSYFCSEMAEFVWPLRNSLSPGRSIYPAFSPKLLEFGAGLGEGSAFLEKGLPEETVLERQRGCAASPGQDCDTTRAYMLYALADPLCSQ